MGAGTIPDATFDRIGAVLTRALEGLTFEQLKRQPAGPESNPIGWLAFHLIRVHDINFSHLLKKDTVWSAEKWYEKFGVPAEFRGWAVIVQLNADNLIAFPFPKEFLPLVEPSDTGRVRQSVQAVDNSQPIGRDYVWRESTFREYGLVVGCVDESLMDEEVGASPFIC